MDVEERLKKLDQKVLKKKAELQKLYAQRVALEKRRDLDDYRRMKALEKAREQEIASTSYEARVDGA